MHVDHTACAYASDAERRDAAVAWLSAGLRNNERALYVADLRPDELAAELAGIPDAAAALERGALVVLPARDAYDLSRPIVAEEQWAMYDAAVEQALADGYRGLRVAADITPLVADPARRAAHLHWEQYADRRMTRQQLSPACLYDTRTISGIEGIVACHPRQLPMPSSFSLHAQSETGAVLVGEVDAFVADAFREVLETMPDTDESIDASELDFIDGRGAAVLRHELMRRRERGIPLVVTAPPNVLRRIWQLCDFEPELLAA